MSVAGGGPEGGPGRSQKTYTVPQAAKILRVSDRAVRKWLEQGRLEGSEDEGSGVWRILQRAMHAAWNTGPHARALGRRRREDRRCQPTSCSG